MGGVRVVFGLVVVGVWLGRDGAGGAEAAVPAAGSEVGTAAHGGVGVVFVGVVACSSTRR